MDPSAALKAFAAVFPAELPDKTMIATVVLVTRYQRPFPVWCGAAAAFTIHVTVAVAAGGLLTLLPATAVKLATAFLFAAGALVLWRSARNPDAAANDTVGRDGPVGTRDLGSSAAGGAASVADADPAVGAAAGTAAAGSTVSGAAAAGSTVSGAAAAGSTVSGADVAGGGVGFDGSDDAARPGVDHRDAADAPDLAVGPEAPVAADIAAVPEVVVGSGATEGLSPPASGRAPSETGASAPPPDGAGATSPVAAGLPSVRAAVVGSFGVIVLAEWGDLTQFATAGMAASTGEPLMVAIGALLALWAVAGLAATVGRQVAARLPIHLIQRAAAGVFALLSLSVLWSLRP